MQKLKLTFLFSLLLVGFSALAQSSIVIKDYIAKYSQIAIEEMRRTGVPASITLAQGIHETQAGQSKLVLSSNNHFGIKCKSEWTGERVYHDDDARGECFRKYESPYDSYRDHSDFLKTRSHYSFLFQLDPTDYEAWAHGLKKAGYATNPKYPQLLIKLIKDYNLQDYTLVALNNKELPKKTEDVITASNTESSTSDAKSMSPRIGEFIKTQVLNMPAAGVYRINRTKVITIPKGASYLAVAQEHNISLARLFDFNDMEPQETAVKDHLLFLQRKRKTGSNAYHIIAKGESLHDIAQAEGIRLESLMEYNWLAQGLQPMPGEQLYLQKKAPQPPKMVSDYTASVTTQPSKQTNVMEGSAGMFTLHTVQPKETLYSLSKKYGVGVDDIKQWNGLESNDLKTGQQLRINTKANAYDKGSR
jgi:LysM repeat protein